MARQTKAQILQAIEDTRILREEIQDRQELHSALQRLGIPANPPEIPLFHEVLIPGKGQGIRAETGIPKGTPVLTEETFFSKPGNAVPPEYRRNRAFLALFCPATQGTPATPEKRFAANSFQMDGNTKGIFLQASRFNHSCRPNAYFAWNPEWERLTVNAILDIRDGDEISINYLPRLFAKRRNQRHIDLRDYAFTCNCPACDSTTDFRVASELRREPMKNLKPQINRENTASKNRLLNILHFAHLLEEEGLVYQQLADTYHLQALWYVMEFDSPTTQGETNLEYRKECREYALQAAQNQLELDVIANGHDSPIVDGTVEFIRAIGGE